MSYLESERASGLLSFIQRQIAVNYRLLKRLYRKTLIVSVNSQTDKTIQRLYLLLNKHKKQETEQPKFIEILNF